MYDKCINTLIVEIFRKEEKSLNDDELLHNKDNNIQSLQRQALIIQQILHTIQQKLLQKLIQQFKKKILQLQEQQQEQYLQHLIEQLLQKQHQILRK